VFFDNAGGVIERHLVTGKGHYSGAQ